MGLRTPFWDRAILTVILNLNITFGRIHTPPIKKNSKQQYLLIDHFQEFAHGLEDFVLG
jgi:hypothetical protein